MRLNDTSVVITGGASGLGGATAELLASHGAKVTVFDLNTEAGEAIAARIGGRFEKVDVTDESSVAAGLDRATEAHGTPRILVNCAGIVLAMKTVGREGQPHALDRFRKVVEVNLIGAYNVISKFAARLSTAEMLDDERGVIINTASVAAYEGQVGQAAYAASKAGVVGMTITVARDLAQFGIRVCTIAPGIFWTPMLGSLSQTVQDSLGQQVPFPSRLGKPEEYAMLAASIIANPMLNGETIRLDGAIRMAPR